MALTGDRRSGSGPGSGQGHSDAYNRMQASQGGTDTGDYLSYAILLYLLGMGGYAGVSALAGGGGAGAGGAGGASGSAGMGLGAYTPMNSALPVLSGSAADAAGASGAAGGGLSAAQWMKILGAGANYAQGRQGQHGPQQYPEAPPVGPYQSNGYDVTRQLMELLYGGGEGGY